MNSRAVRSIIVLLAIVCIAASVLLGGYVLAMLYSAHRNNLEVTCIEQQEVPAGASELAAVGVEARIGYLPLGVWCSYPVDGRDERIVVPPSWRLSGISGASAGLLVVGILAATAHSRLRAAAGSRVAGVG